MKIVPRILALLLLVPSFAYAQTESPAWPPNPAQLFAPGIHVSIAPTDPVDRQDTGSNTDNTRRQVEVEDSNTGSMRDFPYPAGVDKLWIVETRSDGTLILARTQDFDTFTPIDYFVLDPRTGIYTQPALVCGVVSPLPDSKNTWVFYYDQPTHRISVCDAATGESIALVPQNTVPYMVEPSPDGRWIVWATDITATNMTAFYATERSTLQQNFLGEMNARGALGSYTAYGVDRWIDDHRGVLMDYAFPPDCCINDLYSFDVTQANSLKDVITGRSTYYADPPQYRYVQASYIVERYTGISEYVACQLSIYDPLRDQEVDYPVAYDCGNILTPNDDEYVYLGFNGDGTSSLESFNVRSGQQIDYLDGKIEWLDSLSPDNRYAVIAADSNDHLQYEGLDTQFLYLAKFTSPTARLEVVDLETRQIVYQQPLTPDLQADWLANNELAIGVWGLPGDPKSNDPLTMPTVTLSDHGAIMGQIDNVVQDRGAVEIFPERHCVIVWTTGADGTKGIGALDPDTNQITPMIPNLNPPGYQIKISIDDVTDTQLDVQVTPRGTDIDPRTAPSIYYTLDLP